MTNEDRYNKYIKEHCINCKNKNNNLCEIRIAVVNKVILTKCCYYEKGKQFEGYKKPLQRTAVQECPLMRFTQTY